MSYLNRLAFLVSCAIAYGRSQAPQVAETSDGTTLEDMEREMSDAIVEDMAERLGIDPDELDEIDPPSQQ